MKTAFLALAALLTVFVTLPIWLYLLFKILQAVNASDLMWFLYWAYAPASLVASSIHGIVRAATEKK